ncbi:hypothetical protein K470DRAFT_255980 [Piedraia hortae CBS 480.64]|uniref:DNA-directed RNA polymerase subunit n=1 Tax=Piedraia hortae CBS 480.64 TaxID=1314780 RepID=A0A6A7C5U9_9PEZI|nr:hypothetical protein K470DRAFT_255980 [Piedraia hortae CBS 480.64]
MEDPTDKTQKVSFRFCRECSNMLYPREDDINSQLMFMCRNCNSSEPAESACVYRNSLKEEIKETAGNIEDVADDPTLPHTDAEPCAKCGTCDAVFFQSQQRTKETGMALFFVCVNCRHQWSTLDRSR